ncbi:MAG: DUF4367 domain-containing protein [Lachnospiraceae bacterium]|nr:DUF4367 domain-containing protein [Lachnospiraceae bacterium]
MANRTEERLPQVVEDRLQEAYERIRKGKAKQMGKRAFRYRRWTGAAAACAVLVIGSVGVMAAASYFQKELHQEAEEAAYEFSVNYELIPGEYKVTPSYLPEGFQDRGDGKYYGEDGLGITIMPVYTTAELDKLDGEIALAGGIEKVEHTTLSGMEADIITYQEAEKYQKPTDVYLFNPAEGCVIHLISCYPVEYEELLKFADSLTVERVGDAVFETEAERQAREQEEDQAEQSAADAQKTYAELIQAGIPQEKLLGIGEEWKSFDGGEGYTVLDYEYLDTMEGFAEEDFFDFSRFDGWLNADRSLKPYTRLRYDEKGDVIAEEKTEQRFLRVDLKVHRYEGSIWDEVPLDFKLVYVEKRADGSLTWSKDCYDAVPEENYCLQMDESAVYLDQATNRAGEARRSYFFCPLEVGEDLTFTLLFVVDRDREGDFVLAPSGANSSFWQTETESAEQILEELEGYIQLP